MHCDMGDQTGSLDVAPVIVVCRSELISLRGWRANMEKKFNIWSLWEMFSE